MASIVRVEAPPKTSAVSAVARAIARNSALLKKKSASCLASGLARRAAVEGNTEEPAAAVDRDYVRDQGLGPNGLEQAPRDDDDSDLGFGQVPADRQLAVRRFGLGEVGDGGLTSQGLAQPFLQQRAEFVNPVTGQRRRLVHQQHIRRVG